ncbi:hypothetical protein AQI88_00605 [Streptomyces cellostaticus]|uniref:Uncharacterized protein n=1 Tax=Streptomyces cellostaticus TaxID=67285 RepID=A0A101NSY2_9ACTN|nr:hypothetical protein [Streptomyces cellostaticus]KUM98788.1 hypothetical protein AQI88_00605 [Streptomyces cellostaticus]GHI03416.1 hypothetical protein Scel_17370 [Streptomyces cellostaticus]
MQSGTVANRVRIHSFGADGHNRLDSVSMTCAYLGTRLGTRTYGRFGRAGVCAPIVALFTAPSLLRHLGVRPAPAREPAVRRTGSAACRPPGGAG